MALQLLSKFRGKAVKDWSSIFMANIQQNKLAPFTQTYGSYSSFTALGTTQGLSLSSKNFSKLNTNTWSPTYNQANQSPLASSTQSLRLGAANDSLNATTSISISEVDSFEYMQEASAIGAVTELRLYTGGAVTDFYAVTLPTLTANKKIKYKFKLEAGIYGLAVTTNSEYDLGVATVVKTGNPTGTITRIDTKALTLTAGNTITPIVLTGLNNDFQGVGAVLQDTTCCFDSFEFAPEDETEEIYCKGQLEQEVLKSRKITGTITIQKISPLIYAFGMGSGLKNAPIQTFEYLAGYTDTTNTIVPANGQVTLPVGTVIAELEVGDCTYLSPAVFNIGQANLDPNTYHFNPTTGLLTLPTGNQDKVLKIKTNTTKNGTVIDMYPKFGYSDVYMRIARTGSLTGNNQMVVTLEKVQLKAPAISVEDDGDTFEVEFTASLTKEQQATLGFIN